MSNGWNIQIEKLLVNWARQSAINEETYQRRGKLYYRGYLAFGTVLVTTQTTSLMTLINVIAQYATKNSANLIVVLICVAIADTILLILQGLDKFLNFGSEAEKHFEAAKKHNALNKYIVSTLSLNYSDRDSAKEYMESIRIQFLKLQENSPNLPNNQIINQLDMVVYTRIETAQEHSNDQIDLPKLNIQERKVQEAVAVTSRDKNVLKNLDYQWRRLAEHI